MKCKECGCPTYNNSIHCYKCGTYLKKVYGVIYGRDRYQKNNKEYPIFAIIKETN